jgi:hypothetical protein
LRWPPDPTPKYAPIVQWIEHSPPETGMEVRIFLGAQKIGVGVKIGLRALDRIFEENNMIIEGVRDEIL